MTINIHNLIRTNINTVHPDEMIRYYYNLGQVNVRGIMQNSYAEPEEKSVFFMVQSRNLERRDMYTTSGETAMVYLNAVAEPNRPMTVSRFHGRTGDFIQRISDGSWWLVTQLTHDAIHGDDGWCSLSVTRQTVPPEGVETA